MTNSKIKSWIEYCTRGERKVATKLIDTILAKDLLISVFDGEAFSVKLSQDRDAILAAMCSTEQDEIVVRAKDKARLASFTLIYGNAPDGSELIADMGYAEWFEEEATAICDIAYAAYREAV